MVNVKDKLCIICNKKRPSFNSCGEKVPIYCGDCKTDFMININCDICEFEGCNENAWYNYENEIKVKYCKKHSLEDMINLKVNLCIDCNLIASFNYYGEKIPIYCFSHKKDTMVNVINHSLFK